MTSENLVVSWFPKSNGPAGSSLDTVDWAPLSLLETTSRAIRKTDLVQPAKSVEPHLQQANSIPNPFWSWTNYRRAQRQSAASTVQHPA
jgi:hypothetical protein